MYFDAEMLVNHSRQEKNKDKTEGDAIVAVYDLQAVMQLPQGDVSTFYYKSKLNVLNFTIYDMKMMKLTAMATSMMRSTKRSSMSQ